MQYKWQVSFLNSKWNCPHSNVFIHDLILRQLNQHCSASLNQNQICRRDLSLNAQNLSLKTFKEWLHSSLREAPFNLSPPLCGHCPNSNYPPPPHSNGHSGALFFRRDFTIFYPFYHFLPFLPFFLWISAPNHPGKGLDPPKIKQMPVWTWKILL